MSLVSDQTILADRTIELAHYAEMFSTDRAVSEDDVARALRRVGVVETNEALNDLVKAGHLVRLEDGLFLRRKFVAPAEEPRQAARGDNPEYTAFRTAVRGLVDERLRELGLIA